MAHRALRCEGSERDGRNIFHVGLLGEIWEGIMRSRARRKEKRAGMPDLWSAISFQRWTGIPVEDRGFRRWARIRAAAAARRIYHKGAKDHPDKPLLRHRNCGVRAATRNDDDLNRRGPRGTQRIRITELPQRHEGIPLVVSGQRSAFSDGRESRWKTADCADGRGYGRGCGRDPDKPLLGKRPVPRGVGAGLRIGRDLGIPASTFASSRQNDRGPGLLKGGGWVICS